MGVGDGSGEAQPGERLGRWRLLSRLGSGGFGEAWRAVDEDGAEGALKLLPGPPGEELLALAQICHPAVPALLDAQSTPRPFLVMELAAGRPLSAMLRHGAAPQAAALTVAAVLSDALAAVHGAGIIHGDLKPANIVVGSVGRREVKLVDFGMAGHTGGGGTLEYAAPERLGGDAPPSPAADVYALGLVLWELLHGQLPWMEAGLSRSLSHRRRGAPVSVSTPAWLSELLSRLLSPDPTRRPSAVAVADLLAAQGYAQPQLSTAQLRARAAAIYIPCPPVEAAIAAWQAGGGALALCGPPGSGRSTLLRQLVTRLQAEGRPWVRLRADGAPWSGVAQALASPQLLPGDTALPLHPDLEERAELAAALLEQRGGSGGLVVLADDWARLDEGSHRTLAALARRGGALTCVTGETSPDWAEQHAALTPASAEVLAELARRLLGADEALAADLGARLLRTSGGQPKAAVSFLVAAIDQGALLCRAGRWLADPAALDALARSGTWDSAPAIPDDPGLRQLGGLLAAAREPLTRAALAALLDTEEGVAAQLQALQGLGLVVQEQGTVCCTSAAAARALLAACPAPIDAHRRLLRACPLDAPARGWFAVGAQDRELLAREGALLVSRLLPRSAEEAADLSAAIWALVPSPVLAVARATAMREAGQVQAALAWLAPLLEQWPQQAALWLSQARLRASNSDDPEAILADVARAQGCPDMSAALALEAAICEVSARSRREEADLAVEVARAALAGVDPAALVEARLEDWLHLTLMGAQCMARLGRLTEAIEMCAAVPLELGQGQPSRAMLASAHGRLLWMAGRTREAAAHMERAAQAGQGLPARERARLLNNVGLVRYTAGERLQALEAWEACLLLMERLGLLADQVRVHSNLCVGYREVGRWERARQAGTWALAHAEAAGIPDVAALAAGNLGDLAADQGDTAEALGWYDRAEALAQAHGVQGELAELDRRRAALAVAQDAPDAPERVRRALQSAEAVGDQDGLHRARALQAVCLARTGAAEEAEHLLCQTVHTLRESGAAGVLAEVRLAAAEVWRHVGWHERALTECERAAAYAEELGLVPLRDRADRLRSQLQHARKPPETPTRSLDVLLTLAVQLAREDSEPTLLQAIADGARALLDADRAFVLTFLPDSDDFRVAARSGEGSAEPSRSIVGRVRASRREVIVGDLLERGDLRAARSVMAMELRSAMCVPMIDHETLLGAIYIDSRNTSEQQLSASARTMNALAAYAAVAVVNGRRLREKAERAERAAEVVHDLRAPIATMMTLADELAADNAATIAREIRSLGRHALQLAEDLLSERDPHHRPFAAAPVVEEACRHAASAARAQQRQIRCHAAPEASLLGEPSALRRLLGNLLTNALRYGEGDIEVDLHAEADAVVLVVRDHGPGIPAALQQRLFERGVRTGGEGSHGLGTAIALRMVTAMGGTLRADTHPEGGARFTARFPHPSARTAASAAVA